MMTERSAPDDAMLVRYLDGEASEDERAQVDAALEADPEIAARLEQLRRRAAAATAALNASDSPVPAALGSFDGVRAKAGKSDSNAWLRAAIVIGMLGIGALAVPPVRAWLLEAVGVTEQDTPNTTPTPAPVAIDTVAIYFDAPPEFLIELETAQRGGRLIVRVADVQQAAAELRTPGGTESFFVIPEGIQIVNGDVSTAEYEITLPRAVRDVRVRIPGAEDVTYSTATTDRRVFELGR